MLSSLTFSSTSTSKSYTEEDAFWYQRITPEQKQTVQTFKKALEAHNILLSGHDDELTLIRFCKARQWNVQKAVAMYEEMCRWRKENKVDELFDSFTMPELPRVLEVHQHFYHKTDKFGRPIFIQRLGLTDSDKLVEVVPFDKYMQYHIWCWERYHKVYLPACSLAAGKPIMTTAVIIDLNGWGIKNFGNMSQKILNTVSKIDQDNYPEHLGQMFVINTPLVFRGIWSTISLLLDDRTRKKIVILGADYMSALTKIIPIENIPEFLGGTSKCDTKINVGPWAEVRQVNEPPVAKPLPIHPTEVTVHA